jgi:hypothetical protein
MVSILFLSESAASADFPISLEIYTEYPTV